VKSKRENGIEEDLVESGGEKGNVGRETNDEPEEEIPTHLLSEKRRSGAK